MCMLQGTIQAIGTDARLATTCLAVTEHLRRELLEKTQQIAQLQQTIAHDTEEHAADLRRLEDLAASREAMLATDAAAHAAGLQAQIDKLNAVLASVSEYRTRQVMECDGDAQGVRGVAGQWWGAACVCASQPHMLRCNQKIIPCSVAHHLFHGCLCDLQSQHLTACTEHPNTSSRIMLERRAVPCSSIPTAQRREEREE